VAGGLVVNLAASVGFLVLIMHGAPVAALVVGHVLPVPYNLLVAVGVWRSAARYAGPPGLAQAARLVTIVGMTVLSVV
jgi:hypothetical protein